MSASSHEIQTLSYRLASVVDGSTIFIRQWIPAPNVGIKASVQLTHGISEHSGRYDRFARYLAERGYRTYANDLRGHGLSALRGELGKASIHFWEDSAHDMKQLLDLIVTENPGLARFAFGHSLGSALTQRQIQDWGGMYNGAILSGTFGALPGIRSTHQLVEWTEKLKPLAFASETSAQISKQFVSLVNSFNHACGADCQGPDWQTTDRIERERFLSDPLNGFPFCNRMFYSVLQGFTHLWSRQREGSIPKDLPILIMCGTQDPVGEMTTNVRKLMGRYEDLGMQKVHHIFYEGARHEPLNDFCRDRMHQDAGAWLDAHLHDRA